MADAKVRRLGPELCPRCEQATVVPIIWGMPTVAAFERAERGEAVLGGCTIGKDDPVAKCTSCGWTRKRKQPRWVNGPDELFDA